MPAPRANCVKRRAAVEMCVVVAAGWDASVGAGAVGVPRGSVVARRAAAA